MLKTLLVLATLIPATGALAGGAPGPGTCPANAPEGYKWLSGYVDDFRKDGTISDWFTGSLKDHPGDMALTALASYFAGGGDWAKGFAAHAGKGLSAESYANGLACAKVTP